MDYLDNHMSNISSIETKENETFLWQELPALMQPIAGQFVGVSNGKLMVAGGTSWDAPPWLSGTKTWTDKVQIFEEGATQWREVGCLLGRTHLNFVENKGFMSICNNLAL